jgi:hypothetical protein
VLQRLSTSAAVTSCEVLCKHWCAVVLQVHGLHTARLTSVGSLHSVCYASQLVHQASQGQQVICVLEV